MAGNGEILVRVENIAAVARQISDLQAWAAAVWKRAAKENRDALNGLTDTMEYNLGAYNRQTDELEAERDELRRVVEMVEWVKPAKYRHLPKCPWCGKTNAVGHSFDCPRKKALERKP